MGKKKKRGSKAKPHASPHPSRSKKSSKDAQEADSFVVAKNRKGQSFPVQGLSNLGNTCFFNAVMQNVNQSHYFRNRLDLLVTSPTYCVELKLPGSQTALQLTVSDKPGQLTEKLHSFLSQMHQAGGRTLNPRPVFSEICKQASRFAGFHQQDSQELLRYLLDSLRSEEILRIKRAILSLLKVGDKETRRKLTEEERKDIRAYGSQAQLAPTFVDDVFGGVLRSTVVCKECENCTTVHETFLDLSLPILEDKNMKDELISSPGGYQTRSKAKQNKRGRGGNFTYNERTVDETEDLKATQSPPKELSKHQQKKAKKQQEKQARKAAKQANKKSLQEFLKAGDDNTSCDPTKLETQQSISMESQVDQSEAREGINEDQPVTAEDMAEDNIAHTQIDGDESSNPQTQEKEQASGENGEESVVNDQPDESSQALVATYVKEGPKPDGENNSAIAVENLVEELVTVSLIEDDNSCKEAITSESQADTTTSEHDGLHQNEGTNDVNSPPTSQLFPKTADTCISSNSNPGCERSESLLRGDSVKNKPSSIESLKVEADSLEGSFKKFCTPELLTGSNKFACAVCTKEKQEQQMYSPSQSHKLECEAPTGVIEVSVDEHHEETNQGGELPLHENTNETGGKSSTVERTSVEVQEELSFSNGKDEASDAPDHSRSITDQEQSLTNAPESSITQQPLVEDGTFVDDDPVVGGDRERSHCEGDDSDQHEETESGDVQDTIVDQSIKDYDGNEVLSSDAEEEGGEDSKKKESGIVFSDATKQLLIERPPLLLTLHMKRFLQHGRRLRKNNRYISFPALLDIAPFCGHSQCQEYFDNNAQLLYSLYGVVQHSGGMQGGHYTAYVKTRTPLKCDEQTLLSFTHSSSVNQKTGTQNITSSKSDPTEFCGSTKSECESSGCVIDHRTESEATVGVVHTEVSVDITEADNVSESKNSSSVGQSNVVECEKDQMDTDSSFCADVSKTLNFDPSMTDGQWYYISDSHVKTASESEVLRCQAYLLFYERLPLQ